MSVSACDQENMNLAFQKAANVSYLPFCILVVIIFSYMVYSSYNSKSFVVAGILGCSLLGSLSTVSTLLSVSFKEPKVCT